MSSFSKSALLDGRLMLSGFNATLALSTVTGIRIELLGLRANRRHTLGLLSLAVGLPAFTTKRDISSCLYLLSFIYKSNSFTGTYKESTSCPYRLLRKKC